jgi:hypothetical protein
MATALGAFDGSPGGGSSGRRFVLPRHYIFQRLHVIEGQPLHLPEHLEFAAHSFSTIYGRRPRLGASSVHEVISDLVRRRYIATRTGCTMMLYFIPDDEYGCRVEVEYERPLLEAGYAHSALRPHALSFEYSLPFGSLPTAFQLSARELFDELALSVCGSTRSVRREGDVLLSCGESALAAIRGHELVVPPPGSGAVESVERELLLAAAPSARLTVARRPILRSELKRYDELMIVDAAGVTSLAECDGAKFMSLVAPRLAAAIK